MEYDTHVLSFYSPPKQHIFEKDDIKFYEYEVLAEFFDDPDRQTDEENFFINFLQNYVETEAKMNCCFNLTDSLKNEKIDLDLCDLFENLIDFIDNPYKIKKNFSWEPFLLPGHDKDPGVLLYILLDNKYYIGGILLNLGTSRVFFTIDHFENDLSVHNDALRRMYKDKNILYYNYEQDKFCSFYEDIIKSWEQDIDDY